MNDRRLPLVSICTTFWNGEKYLPRLLDSCLDQTYKNIELVIVDDASTDKSEEIIRNRMSRDIRIRYVRNPARMRLTESELTMFKAASGELVMMLGADDWLPRHYIENAVRSFLAHPDAAGVIPDLTTLIEESSGTQFIFQSRRCFKPGVYSAAWFARHMYKPVHLFISAYALVRREDFISALEYYMANYYRRADKSLPDELRGFFQRAYGMDVMTFLEILSRYPKFVFDGSLNYIKVSHSDNQRFEVAKNSLNGIFKDAYFYLLIFTYIYKTKWPEFYRRMKIYKGAEAISSAFLTFVRQGFRPAFLKTTPGDNFAKEFFGQFSALEIAASGIWAIPMLVGRLASFAGRKLGYRIGFSQSEVGVFAQENFLNPEGEFAKD